MKKFLKGCLLIVLSFVSLFMFLVTVAILKDDSTSTENSTSVETDKTAEKNPAPVETKKTAFKPSENFILARNDDYYECYLDTSSVNIIADTETAKEWSQDVLIYRKYTKEAVTVSYHFTWDEVTQNFTDTENFVAIKNSPILTSIFKKSWQCAFNKKIPAVGICYTTYPHTDTLVLNWKGTDYFVKANSLNYFPDNLETSQSYSCDVVRDGVVKHYDFNARGVAILTVDGKTYADSSQNKFVDEVYSAICDKLIHNFYSDNLSIQVKTLQGSAGN